MGDLGLNNLRPKRGSRANSKRLGRGKGTGQGKTAGRGHKGYNARSGGGVRPGYEGGQMPAYMRLGKLRGPYMKKSMPMGPFRTATVPVNVGRLAATFSAGAEVTPQALRDKGIVKNTKAPIKILGGGEIGVALTVRMHAFSQTAWQKIEAAGGKPELL